MVRARLSGMTVTMLVPLLVASGMPSASGVLAQAPPANDDIGNAIVVPALPYNNSQDTTEATTDASDPDCVGNNQTVWYRFTPGASHEVQADTFGSNYDTTLSVWTGNPGSLQLVGCNDDSGSLQSKVTFMATAGVRYWVMAGSFSAEEEQHTLVLHMAVAPPAIQLGVSIRATGTVAAGGVATVRGRVTCSRPVDLTLVGSVRQRWRNPDAVGWFSVQVSCADVARWTGTTAGETNSFAPGTAKVGITARGFDSLRGEPVQKYTTRWVTLVAP